jgi:hypothetical protein
MSARLANACINDLIEKVKTVTRLKDRVFYVTSDDDLMDKLKGLVYPVVAVIYAGIASEADSGSTSRHGLSTELGADILFFFKNSPLVKVDPNQRAIDDLDEVRDAIKGTKSPAGHLWRFGAEHPIELKSEIMGYRQHWTTPVILT